MKAWKASPSVTLKILSALTVCIPILGCGAGGGSVSVSNSTPGPSSDLTQTSAGISGGSAPGGCSKASFTPNFASLVPLYRWAKFPVKVYFQNSGIITNDAGQQVDLQQAAMTGFSEWSSVTNGSVAIQATTDPAAANVTVHFTGISAVPTIKDVLGLEQSTLNSDSTVKSADIMLTTWPGMTAANIASFHETAAHEFGHALGINGHSDSPGDVMYASHSLIAEKPLSARDVNTLLSDYCGEFNRAVPASGGNVAVLTNK